MTGHEAAAERARYDAARSRAVYVVNQPAHADGTTHQAVSELIYAADALAAALSAAQEWYRDHVTSEGIYDESVWGDPFAISPQLRAALASADTEKP